MKRATAADRRDAARILIPGPVTCRLTNKLQALLGRKWGRATAFAENPRDEREHNRPSVDHDQ